MILVKKLETFEKNSFLLPFGSFLSLIYGCTPFGMGQLSTPFWEFHPYGNYVGTEYCYELSTPFWEFQAYQRKMSIDY